MAGADRDLSVLSSGRFSALLGSKGRHTRCVLAAALLLVLATAAKAQEGPAFEPKPGAAAAERATPPPVNLFLGGTGALDALLKQPDFVLLKGDEYRKLLDRLAGTAGPREPAAVVDSVAVLGTIVAERADFSVGYGITLRLQGPTWVPIRLDEQTVTAAREGKRELPLKWRAGGSWHVELRGAGVHRVDVDLKVPLRATADGHRIDLAIPEAATTRFAWEIAERVTEAATGSGEVIDLEPIAGRGC